MQQNLKLSYLANNAEYVNVPLILPQDLLRLFYLNYLHHPIIIVIVIVIVIIVIIVIIIAFPFIKFLLFLFFSIGNFKVYHNT
jgi:hypothetical protein